MAVVHSQSLCCGTAASVIDLVEGYQMLPLEASGMKRPHNPLTRALRREVYRSFSEFIANEAPPHYQQFYVSYAEGKELIKTLAALTAVDDGTAAMAEPPMSAKGFTARMRRLLQEAHQELALRSSAAELTDPHVSRQLCTQLLIHDMLGAETQKCNQFAALSFRRIEQSVRAICVKLRLLMTLDKQRQTFYARPEAEPAPAETSAKAEKKQQPRAVTSGTNTPLSNNGGVQASVETETLPQSCFDGTAATAGATATAEDDAASSSSSSTTSQQRPAAAASGEPPKRGQRGEEGDPQIARPDFETWRLERLYEYEVALEAQAAEVAHLDMYTRINFKGLVRLATLYDRVLGSTTAPWTQANVMKEYFANVDIDSLLILMSVAWKRWREAKARDYLQSDRAADAWKPPESFIRNTTKYWVRPDQVVRTKLSILRHMPYLIFGINDSQLNALVDPYCSDVTAPPNVEEGQMVSSVYFDSVDAWSYRRRLMRLEGAELVRFRWYGENDGSADKEVFIERKTHHEKWSGESSTKERFVLPQSRVPELMDGQLDVAEFAAAQAKKWKKVTTDKKVQNILRLGNEIQDLIIDKHLEPMVRTSYLRSAFQLSDRNDVRFSLDVNLCMVDERRREVLRDRSFWCRVGEEICGKDEVVRFPYAVLEVKLQTVQPEWVSAILADVAAVMVFKFSKFQHGMAFLHRSLVNGIGLPHWIPDFEREGHIAGFGTGVVGANRRDTVASAVDDHLLHRGYNQRSTLLGEGVSRLLSRARLFARSVWRRQLRQRMSSQPGGAVAHHAAGYVSLEDIENGTTFLPPQQQDTLTTNDDTASFVAPADRTAASIARCEQLTSVNSMYPLSVGTPYAHYADTDTTAANARRLRPQELALKTLEWMRPWAEGIDSEAVLRIIYARSKNIKRNDPKAFFASERTLLHYVQKGLYIGGLATALLSLYDPLGSLIGLMLGVAAIFILAFSLWVFWRRCERLDRRVTKALEDDRERVDSASGPVVLFAVLASGLTVALALNLTQTLEYVFGSKQPMLPPHVTTSIGSLFPKRGLLDVPAFVAFLDRTFGSTGKVHRFFDFLGSSVYAMENSIKVFAEKGFQDLLPLQT